MMNRPSGLGKGLGSLLPVGGDEGLGMAGQEQAYFSCSVDAITPNHYQPRKIIRTAALEQLSESIKEKGIIQPLIVRRKDKGDGYELIAGERRWRAAKLAGLKDVPVVVKDVSKADRLEMALIENIQRQDLNPVEEAEAYQRLLEEFRLTQSQVAQRVGKERSTVANALRLLQLPDFAKQDLAEGVLSMGHARVLLGLEDDEAKKEVRDQIVSRGLSVRQAEALVKERKQRHKPPRPRKMAPEIPESYCRTLVNDLTRHLGTKSRIVQNGARGKVEIEYYSSDDLERLLGLIVGLKR